MVDEVKRLLLPFTIPSEDRKKPLDKRVEFGAVFCLAERSREKGRGLISKKVPEEIVFITEACYPLWLVPWKGRTLLFDGFGTMNHTISFNILPDAAVFIHEIKGSADKLEAYSAFLNHNLNYFKGFSGKGQKVIKGLIMDQPLINDFFSYLPRARRVRRALSDMTILSPAMNEAAVKASLKELSNLMDGLKGDVKNLRDIVKLLIRTTQNHVKAINAKIENTRRRSEIEIARFKSDSMKKMEKMRREYDEKIIQVSADTSRLIQSLSQERVRLETDKKRLSIYAERCETEISAASVRKDEVEEEHWTQELEKCRQELLEVDKSLQEVNKSMTDAEPSRDLEISRLKSEYNSQTEAIMTGLRSIEAARDSQIQIGQEALQSLEDSTSVMISHINKLIDSRNLALSELDKIGFPVRKRDIALVYLPFFLICNRQELKKRYVAFPPSIANTMSGVTKIKGALKSFKVGMLLQEISMPMSKLVNRFISLIEQNPMLEDEVMKACLKRNILRSRDFRKGIERSLEDLSTEGWLSESEFKSFKERLEETKP